MNHPLRFAALLLLVAAEAIAAVATTSFKDAVKARLENNYAVVLFADGTKKMVPLASLSAEDRAAVTTLSTDSPLPKGKSTVTIADTRPVAQIKKTIVTTKTEGSLETVQLCAPGILRDQIGGTCMLYGRVHWLDIAGYYVSVESIYKVPVGNPDRPWENSRYLQGLDNLIQGFKPAPVILDLPGTASPFDWAREQLRKGRPILASFPREVWQALPPGFIAAHPWGGGNVGHQVVVNGFTWNAAANKGTFHIINSWAELPEFDLTTDAAKGGVLVIWQSVCPKGEPPPEKIKEIVKTITFVRSAGKSNLYEVETNLGSRKILAVSEAAARVLVETEK